MDGSGSDDTLSLWVSEVIYHYKGCIDLHCFSFELLAGGEDKRHHEPIPQTRFFLLLSLFALRS